MPKVVFKGRGVLLIIKEWQRHARHVVFAGREGVLCLAFLACNFYKPSQATPSQAPKAPRRRCGASKKNAIECRGGAGKAIAPGL